jgi:hypothetical protein
MYRMILRPEIVVRVIGPIDMRTGARIKFAGIAYIDSDNRLTARSPAEFHRLFSPLDENQHKSD